MGESVTPSCDQQDQSERVVVRFQRRFVVVELTWIFRPAAPRPGGAQALAGSKGGVRSAHEDQGTWLVCVRLLGPEARRGDARTSRLVWVSREPKSMTRVHRRWTGVLQLHGLQAERFGMRMSVSGVPGGLRSVRADDAQPGCSEGISSLFMTIWYRHGMRLRAGVPPLWTWFGRAGG